MNTSVLVPTVWLLAMVVAVALSGGSVRRAADAVAVTVSAAVWLLASAWLSVQPSWVGIVVGLISAWRLIGKPSLVLDRLMAAACLALAAALHLSHGLDPGLAIGIAAVAILVAMLIARPGPVFRGWALAVAALVAPVVALLPDIVAGWQSAELLNRTVATSVFRPVPLWALVFLGLSLVAGLVRGLWFRR